MGFCEIFNIVCCLFSISTTLSLCSAFVQAFRRLNALFVSAHRQNLWELESASPNVFIIARRPVAKLLLLPRGKFKWKCAKWLDMSAQIKTTPSFRMFSNRQLGTGRISISIWAEFRSATSRVFDENFSESWQQISNCCLISGPGEFHNPKATKYFLESHKSDV